MQQDRRLQSIAFHHISLWRTNQHYGQFFMGIEFSCRLYKKTSSII
jgi:hypothetical protein